MFLSMSKNIGYQNETQKQNTGHHPIRPQLIGYWFSFHPFLNGDMMHLLCQSRIYTALFLGIQLKQIFYSGMTIFAHIAANLRISLFQTGVV